MYKNLGSLLREGRANKEVYGRSVPLLGVPEKKSEKPFEGGSVSSSERSEREEKVGRIC